MNSTQEKPLPARLEALPALLPGALEPSLGLQILDAVPDAVIAVDRGFRIIVWNQAAQAAFGKSAGEAMGADARELLEWGFPSRNLEQVYGALMESGQLELEMFHALGDGSKVPFHARLRLLKDAAGETCGAVALLRDVTDSRWMENELNNRAGELAAAKVQLEADLDAMSRLHHISTRFVEEEALIGLLEEIADAAAGITHADMCAIQYLDAESGRFRVAFQKGLDPGMVKILESHHSREMVEASMERMGFHLAMDNAENGPPMMGGKGNAALLSFGVRALQAVPMMVRSGEMTGMLTTMFRQTHETSERELRMLEMLARLTADIVERFNAAAELRRSSQGTELLYEVVEKLLADGKTQANIENLCTKVMEHLGCDVFFNYLYEPGDASRLRLNACAGVSAGEREKIERLERERSICGSVANSCARLVVEDVQLNADARLSCLKDMGVRAYACHPLQVMDRTLGTLSFGARSRNSFTAAELALMKAVCGHVAVAINRSRTEEDLKKLTSELYEKNKLVTDFFTNISHEFKTPLSIILVDLQLMEYRLRDVEGETREKLRKMVAVMRQNALRLLRLIGNLLDVTKIDAGFMRARLINTDVVGLVSGLVETVRNYAENAGIEISFSSSRDSRDMPLDCEKIERVILNLLSNAVKHTPEGGHIAVTLRHTADRVTLCVADDGEGIPPDKQEFIFDRFRQVNTSLTRSSEGCGIGLSLSKALVELLEGRIWFESDPGRGSRFFVELPVLRENERVRSPEIDGMPRSRKVEMEFSDINRAGKSGS